MTENTMTDKQIRDLARRKGISPEEYAEDKKLVRCIICGRWGLRGFSMRWANRGEKGPPTWRCRYHED